MRRRSAAAGIVDVDRIGAARDRVVEVPRLQHVVARQRVASHDAPRLANADLRSGRRQTRVLEARHALAKELEQLHHLQPRLDLGARQVVGIERIDVDDARHVDRHFVGIGRDEERDELARHVDDAVVDRALAP